MMNETIDRTIEFTLGFILMLLSLAYTFWSMTEWASAYEHIPSAATVFIEETQIPEEVSWNGNQVVAKLYRLSIENILIEVDGILFQTEADVLTYQQTVDLDARYSKVFEMNDSGEIIKINFTKL